MRHRQGRVDIGRLLAILLLLTLLGVSDDILVVGTRLMNTGSSVVVARQTTTWTPDYLTSTIAWSDAAEAVTITLVPGINVSPWDDKSGIGYHLTPPSGGNQRN